jgi:hypothetical protein
MNIKDTVNNLTTDGETFIPKCEKGFEEKTLFLTPFCPHHPR